jgi:hypothetical protein
MDRHECDLKRRREAKPYSGQTAFWSRYMRNTISFGQIEGFWRLGKVIGKWRAHLRCGTGKKHDS